MLSRWSLLLVVLAWSGVLPAQKVSLITSVARNGVALRVEIESLALDKIAPNLANYYKEILIDQLACYKNPLEAHVDLSRFWFVTDSLNKIHRQTGEAVEPSPQSRKEYESMMQKLKAEYDPSLSTSWEDKHLVMQKLTAQAIEISTEVAVALFGNKAFRESFSNEDLQFGVNLNNFLSTKLKEFEDADVVAIDDALQELSAQFPQRFQQVNQEIAFLNKLRDQKERVEYAFNQAVRETLLNKLLDGTDEAFPSLVDRGISHEEDQQAAHIIKDIWIAVYRQEAMKD